MHFGDRLFSRFVIPRKETRLLYVLSLLHTIAQYSTVDRVNEMWTGFLQNCGLRLRKPSVKLIFWLNLKCSWPILVLLISVALVMDCV